MFADVADKPGGASGPARTAQSIVGRCRDLRARKAYRGCVNRGRRLNMANNPKKVKDPTEVALSAIQEALNISDAPADDNARGSVHSDVTPTGSPSDYADSPFNDSSFDTRSSTDRP